MRLLLPSSRFVIVLKRRTLCSLFFLALLIAQAAEAATFTDAIHRGDHGDDVRMLQQVLQDFGYFPKNIAPTGYYGAVTVTAVRTFQKQKGLDRAGSVGPLTRAALNFLSHKGPAL